MKSAIKNFAHRFEERFEIRFDNLARDPKMLSLAASGLNLIAAQKLQMTKLESELASLRARLKIKYKKQSRDS